MLCREEEWGWGSRTRTRTRTRHESQYPDRRGFPLSRAEFPKHLAPYTELRACRLHNLTWFIGN